MTMLIKTKTNNNGGVTRSTRTASPFFGGSLFGPSWMDAFLNTPLTNSGTERERMIAHMPAVDVIEHKSHYALIADLPGLKREDVELSLEHGVLTLRGERHATHHGANADEADNSGDHVVDETDSGERYARIERSFGVFERRFTVGDGIDAEHIEARFQDGVLHVTLPKVEQGESKRTISIG